MKRRLLIIAIFLLLGAVVNVAVAWGISTWVVVGEGPFDDGSIRTPAGETVPFLHWKRRGIQRIKWHLYLRRAVPASGVPSKRAPVWSDVGRWAAYNDNRHPFFVNVREEVAAGWPLLSMRTCCAVDPVSGGLTYEPPAGAVPLPDHQSVPSWHLARSRALPLSPIWPGFAINTAFYASLLWLLIPGPFALRRFLRVRRGLCPKCAYPMGGSVVCTECGRLLPKRVVA